MNSFASGDNLSDSSSLGMFGDENKNYAEVTGIDVLRLHESLKNRNKKLPPPCTISFTNLGNRPPNGIGCDLRGEGYELRRFKKSSSCDRTSVLGEHDVNTFAGTAEEGRDHPLSVMRFSTEYTDKPYRHGSPYGSSLSKKTLDTVSERLQIGRMATPDLKPHSTNGSSMAKRKDPVKAHKFAKLVERLVVTGTMTHEEVPDTDSSSPPYAQQRSLNLAGSQSSDSKTIPFLNATDLHRSKSRVPNQQESSASECSNLEPTPNASRGSSEGTAGSSISGFENIKAGDFSTNIAGQNGVWSFSSHGGAEKNPEKHKSNSFNPNASNFQPSPSSFNPNAASFAPTSAIPMSDAAAQAVEKQKGHQQQLAQVISQPTQLAPEQQNAATINLGMNDWANPPRHQQRRQPLSNIFADAATSHSTPSLPEIGQDLLNSLAAQHIAFLTQQNVIMAATLSQQQNYAACLGAHNTLGGVPPPLSLADPLVTAFNHQLSGPNVPPFGSVASVNNGMHTVPRFPISFSSIPLATTRHSQNGHKQQPQVPRNYHGPYSGGYPSSSTAPPPSLVGTQLNVGSVQQPEYIPVQQRSLVSLAGAPPTSQKLALSMPLANQHLLKFDADGMLIDVPKPRDHSDPQLQMAYEAAIEWKKANLPGYAQSCRERQNNRIANKLQSGRQYQGTHRNMYA